MKTIWLLSIAAVGLQQLNGLLEGLNAWVELGLKVAGLAAFMGAAWRWLVGPGFRRTQTVVRWVRGQLELIGTLDERLDSIEEELTRGHEHFGRIDESLETLTSEEARAVRRSINSGQPVGFTESGGVERRVSDTAA